MKKIFITLISVLAFLLFPASAFAATLTISGTSDNATVSVQLSSDDQQTYIDHGCSTFGPWDVQLNFPDVSDGYELGNIGNDANVHTWTGQNLTGFINEGSNQAQIKGECSGSDTRTYFFQSSIVTLSDVLPTQTPTPTPVQTYNLTGNVFNDTNQNEVHDAGETSINGATVTLNTGQTSTTDANGNYTFLNLQPGTYTETLTVPSGYTMTTSNPATVSLNSDTSQNFGIVTSDALTPTLVISGAADNATVTLQLTPADEQFYLNNGCETVGSGGWFVALNFPDVSDGHTLGSIGNDSSLHTWTGQNLTGFINEGSNQAQIFAQCDGFNAGDYQLHSNLVVLSDVLQPSPTPTSTPTPTVTPTPSEPPTPTPTPIPTYILSGTIYNDDNQNGLQDTGENNYQGATVTLTSGSTVIGTTTTDVNGNYSFPNLQPGTYTDSLTIPNGYSQTTTNPATIAISANTTQNFGIYSKPHVGTVTVNPNPVLVNTSVTATTTFTDGDISDTHTAQINWDVQGNTITSNTCQITAEPNGSTPGTVSCTLPNGYSAANIYSVAITVSDNDGANDSSTDPYVSVYAPTPSGKFAAGQAYVSPSGTFAQNPAISTGIVQLALSYKYNGTMPAEQQQFMMTFSNNITFSASSISSLVISNGIGTLTGTGTFGNSNTVYNFLVTGKDSTDAVRIKITDPNNNNAVIYDTQNGASNTATPTTSVTGPQGQAGHGNVVAN